MLSTVLNIIIFEDCRNQWSMSRPLLGLILLNEKVKHPTRLLAGLEELEGLDEAGGSRAMSERCWGSWVVC